MGSRGVWPTVDTTRSWHICLSRDLREGNILNYQNVDDDKRTMRLQYTEACRGSKYLT